MDDCKVNINVSSTNGNSCNQNIDNSGNREEQTKVNADIEECEHKEISSDTVTIAEKNEEKDIANDHCSSSDKESLVKNLEQADGVLNSEDANSPKADVGSSYDPKNVHYEGDLAIYTDPTSGYQYQWSSEKNEWEQRNNVQYGFEDDTHVYTDSDGVKYFWDKEKNAWFPKVDDDFMAHYQMSYGFIDPADQKANTLSEDKIEEKPVKPTKKPKGEKRKASEPTWFEASEEENTKVYVSNLPTSTTEEEFIDLMQKCGLVMRDQTTSKFKVKLYKEPGTGYLKGDALCTYIRIESVELALNLLDGYEFKGNKIKVERAKFEMKGAYDPKLKPKMKKKKEKLKLKKQQEKLFDWRPEKMIGRAKHEKVVIVKNLFDPSIFDKDVSLILEFQQDLREECSKLGEVRKIIIYDRHPDGVAQINMGTPEEADEVVNLLNGRWFMKRLLNAETWDGRTKFKIAETDSQISKRLGDWDKFLEDGDSSKKQSESEKKEVNR